MKNSATPWLKDLGLNAEDFRRCPQGEDPLFWGLKNQLIPEGAYQIWASETYGLPRLEGSFFQTTFDPHILQSYLGLYNWDRHCYPIYEWNNVVYVATLRPETIPLGDKKVCLVVGDFSSMVQAWKSLPGVEATITPPPLPAEPPQHTKTATKAPPPPPEMASLGDLDFSSMDSLSQPSKTPLSVPAAEHTQTKVDASPMNNLTSATQTVQERKTPDSELRQEDLPFPEFNFDDLSHGDLALESDPKKVSKPAAQKAPTPPPPVSPVAKSPARGQPEVTQSPLDFDFNFDLPAEPVASQPTPPPPAPKAKPKTSEAPVVPQKTFAVVEDETSEPSAPAPSVDDDYTPVPFISEEERARFKHTSVQMGRIPKPEGPIENTVTDNGRPASHTPVENLITDTDLTRCVDLKNCRTSKDVMSHVFLHLRKDYKKLMWIQLAEDSRYYPTFVYGNWAMTPESWTKPVDLLKPNIFRIASQSNLPFHGEVSDNEINSAYFKAWTAGRKPDVVTIFPVTDDDVLKGFVVAFSINEEFDEVASLTKIGNLMSICSSHLFAAQQKKSA